MRILSLILSLFIYMATSAQNVNINRIEPAHWYAGMANSQLQLMVYGENIWQAEVGTDYPGVQITNVVHLLSPNYLLVYLDLSAAQPGDMTLYFRTGKQVLKQRYTLRARQSSSRMREGFTSADVMYLVMPDRFANGNPKNDVVQGMRDTRVNRLEPNMRHGGDLAGLRQNLDYIEDLGVTALWLTPVQENDMPGTGAHSSYHGYAITDYYKVDPRLGTNDDYRAFVADCHARGLKVVMDLVFNHCGLNHPWCQSVPADDWFHGTTRDHVQTNYRLTPVLDPYASQLDRTATVEGWFASTMPDLNQRNPHLMRYLVQMSIWWIETMGIDGIRMDTYPYADREAMAAWMREIHTEYPHLHVVGETWVGETAYTASWQRGQRLSQPIDSNLDAVMDFAFFDHINDAMAEETDNMFDGLNRVYNTLCYDYLYSDPRSVVAFLDNHDTNRFLRQPVRDEQDLLRLKQAMTILLTIPRTPQIYYGTEILMHGNTSITDGDVRRDFPGGWRDDKSNCFNDKGRTAQQNEMHAFTRKLLQWRRGNRAISHGLTTQFIPHDGVYVYSRRYGEHRVLVVLNGTSKASEVDMSRYAEVIGGAQKGRDVITGRDVELSGRLRLTSRESLVIEI